MYAEDTVHGNARFGVTIVRVHSWDLRHNGESNTAPTDQRNTGVAFSSAVQEIGISHIRNPRIRDRHQKRMD